MTRPLSGRTAIVTGAGKRVGKEIALELARAGADVCVHVNRSRAEGEEAAHEIAELGVRTAVVTADQGDVGAIERACGEARAALGDIDVLVNSAAIWPMVDVLECTLEDWDLALNVNLRGPFFWSRILGEHMVRGDGGSIVSIADVSHDRPWADAVPYCIAKSGVVSMTYGLAKALAPKVRVNAVGPGPILFPENYPEEKARADRDATLRGREGAPADIARAVRYLVEAENVTGVLLPVDGGYRFGI